jgi:hypothetical protein
MNITEKIDRFLNEEALKWDKLKKWLNSSEWKKAIPHKYEFYLTNSGFAISIEGIECIIFNGNELKYNELNNKGKMKSGMSIKVSQAEIYKLCLQEVEKAGFPVQEWK